MSSLAGCAPRVPGLPGGRQGINGITYIADSNAQGTGGEATFNSTGTSVGGTYLAFLASGTLSTSPSFSNTRLDPSVTGVPDPTSLAILGAGCIGLAGFRRCRA